MSGIKKIANFLGTVYPFGVKSFLLVEGEVFNLKKFLVNKRIKHSIPCINVCQG